MGLNIFEKKYKKVPIKIGMGIAIAIGLGFLIFFWMKKNRKTKPMPMPHTLQIFRFVGYETKFVGYIPYIKNMSVLFNQIKKYDKQTITDENGKMIISFSELRKIIKCPTIFIITTIILTY